MYVFDTTDLASSAAQRLDRFALVGKETFANEDLAICPGCKDEILRYCDELRAEADDAVRILFFCSICVNQSWRAKEQRAQSTETEQRARTNSKEQSREREREKVGKHRETNRFPFVTVECLDGLLESRVEL